MGVNARYWPQDDQTDEYEIHDLSLSTFSITENWLCQMRQVRELLSTVNFDTLNR